MVEVPSFFFFFFVPFPFFWVSNDIRITSMAEGIALFPVRIFVVRVAPIVGRLCGVASAGSALMLLEVASNESKWNRRTAQNW